MAKPEVLPIFCRAADSIGRSFLTYLRLCEFLRRRASQGLSSRPLRVITSTRAFWDGVRSEEIRVGDQVEFRDAFVTEWIPRLPGVTASREQVSDRRDPSLLSIDRILAMESAPEDGRDRGVGVIRLADPDRPASTIPLSITTPDAWLADLGVPLQVSPPVYAAFRNRMMRGCAATDRLRALVVHGPLSQLDASLLKAIGSRVSDDFMRKMTTPLGIPAVHLDLDSPLDVHFQYHDSHPPGFLSAVVRSRHSMKVVHHLSNPPHETSSSNVQATVSTHPVSPYIQYTNLASRRQLDSVDDVDAAAEAFKKIRAILLPGQPDPASHGIDQIAVLTEFDVRHRRFATSIPVEGLQRQSEDMERAAHILSDLQRARPE